MTIALGQSSSPLNAGQIRGLLEAGTPTAVALSTGAYVTAASWSVDDYTSRGGELLLQKSDGSEIRRRVLVRTNSLAASDATTVKVSSLGGGSHADFTERDTIDADLSGAGTSQVARLRIKATANGASWTATFYPDFLKRAAP